MARGMRFGMTAKAMTSQLHEAPVAQALMRWLGRLDSNQGMAESKSAALPLGYAPSTMAKRSIVKADHTGAG